MKLPLDEREEPAALRPVHTYSIVARDSETGELGVAVQSHWFNVGPLVPWAEAGVGAVATQSFVEPSFGLRGLALLGAGKSPEEALAELLAGDPGEAVRQVALVDAKGRVAAHTGARCIASAGHRTGEGYSAQANMMVSDAVVPALAQGYEEAEGPLAQRLLAALEAAQAAGGDVRGQQSAALLVVAAEGTGAPWVDRLVDLRVEDHPQPVAELRRLDDLRRAYRHMSAGDAALEEGETERALAEYAAAAALVPKSLEIRFWNAFTLAIAGRLERAAPIFREVFAADANWASLLRRLPASGLTDDATVAAILSAAGAR